jgi:hypothetical protein
MIGATFFAKRSALAFVLATARRRTSAIHPDPFLYQVKNARLRSVWGDQTHGSYELFLVVDRLDRCDVAPINERKRQAACSAPDIQDLFAILRATEIEKQRRKTTAPPTHISVVSIRALGNEVRSGHQIPFLISWQGCSQ